MNNQYGRIEHWAFLQIYTSTGPAEFHRVTFDPNSQTQEPAGPLRDQVMMSLSLHLERPLHNRSRVHSLGRAFRYNDLNEAAPADVYGI
jgi:hypothetical protein